MNNAEIDDSALQNLFRSIDEENRKQILFKALKSGADKLASNTKIQLKSKLGAGASSPNRWNGKTMESGIRVKADKDYCEVAVNVMGDFRLKFFEKGTNIRRTKKKANRGSIKALYFFKSARANSDEVAGIIDNSISESLKRITKE